MARTKKNTPKQAALEQLRAAYMQEIEQLAEKLRPQFEAGEFYGFRSREFDKMEREASAMPGDTKRQVRRRMAYTDAAFRSMAMERLEREIERRCLRHSFDKALMVMLCSPSAAKVHGTDDDPVGGLALSAVTWDVLRIARARRWYKPTKDESPDAWELAS